jgi:RNA polymerase sigma-70 factor, ECF subfamily
METTKPDDATALLRRAAEEGPGGRSAEELLPLVYDELRRLARSMVRGDRRDRTLQPTALVHEAFVRLVNQKEVDWKGRTHFFAIGAKMMRRLLIDDARHHGRVKRGGEMQRVPFELAEGVFADGREIGPEEVLSLDAALEKLAKVDPRQAQVVELRFFGGLDVSETAEILGVSKRTAEVDWTHARAWLRRELDGKRAGA